MITRSVPDLHPDSSKWYHLVWSQSELGESVTIQTVTWTVPTGLQSDETSQSGLAVGIRLSTDAATVGEYYDVVCQIVTSDDETLHETMRITVSTDGH